MDALWSNQKVSVTASYTQRYMGTHTHTYTQTPGDMPKEM